MRRGSLFFGLGLVLSSLPSPARSTDVCFSPDQSCDRMIIQRLDRAQTSIDVAVFAFTHPGLAEALVSAKSRGVVVRVVMDQGQAADARGKGRFLSDSGIPVKVARGGSGGLMHEKFALIDSGLVLSGSFNWTVSAARRNSENVFFLEDVGWQFQKRFNQLWVRAKPISGTGAVKSPFEKRRRSSRGRRSFSRRFS